MTNKNNFNFIFFSFTEHIEAIKCYKCSVSPGNRQLNTTTQLCSQFDESEKFIVDCPYSTMCSKKILRIKLQGKDVDTIVKDCALQKYTEQVFKNGSWHRISKIEEPYEEGCDVTASNSLTEQTTTCHCRGSLCNSAPKETNSYSTDAMAVIFVFNALKYLRTVD